MSKAKNVRVAKRDGKRQLSISNWTQNFQRGRLGRNVKVRFTGVTDYVVSTNARGRTTVWRGDYMGLNLVNSNHLYIIRIIRMNFFSR